MHPRSKTGVGGIPPAVEKEFGRQLMGMGTICIGSGGEMQSYSISELKEFFLEAAVDAALKCWDQDERWFAGQEPNKLARQFVPVLVRAAFSSTLERNHAWLRRLIERLAESDELEARLEKAFTARKKVAPWVPRRPPADRGSIMQQMEDALKAGQSIQHLMHRVALKQARIAERMGERASTVSRIVRGGKHVSQEKKHVFLRVVAGNLKPA
jgi:predicted XRE-type DNA-binding protein